VVSGTTIDLNNKMDQKYRNININIDIMSFITIRCAIKSNLLLGIEMFALFFHSKIQGFCQYSFVYIALPLCSEQKQAGFQEQIEFLKYYSQIVNVSANNYIRIWYQLTACSCHDKGNPWKAVIINATNNI